MAYRLAKLKTLVFRALRLCACASLLCAPLPILASDTQAPSVSDVKRDIHRAQAQLAEAAAELREAKFWATEKHLELQDAQRVYRRESTTLNYQALHHAQQRTALAEMGVISRAAKFDRIQRRLEYLAGKHQLLASAVDIEPSAEPPAQNSPQEEPVPVIEVAAENLSIVTHSLETTDAAAEPVLEYHGKLTDTQKIGVELRKLEQHLIVTAEPQSLAQNVKAFGTAIQGEIALVDLGGNQFYAQFTAPKGEVSLIVGARLNTYQQTQLHLTFNEQEAGQEFVLFFDISAADEPRALVVQQKLLEDQQVFATSKSFY